MNIFIDDCKRWYRMWSVQLAALVAAAAAYAAENPQPILDALNSIPPQWQWIKPVLVFAVTFGVPTAVRMMRQPKLEPTQGEQG